MNGPLRLYPIVTQVTTGKGYTLFVVVGIFRAWQQQQHRGSSSSSPTTPIQSTCTATLAKPGQPRETTVTLRRLPYRLLAFVAAFHWTSVAFLTLISWFLYFVRPTPTPTRAGASPYPDLTSNTLHSRPACLSQGDPRPSCLETSAWFHPSRARNCPTPIPTLAPLRLVKVKSK